MRLLGRAVGIAPRVRKMKRLELMAERFEHRRSPCPIDEYILSDIVGDA